MKVVELKKVEQESKMIEYFVQKFRRAVRESGYEGRLLIKKFKQDINGVIWYRLMKLEYQPRSIKQWYERMSNLNRYQRESKKKKERLQRRGEIGAQAPRQNTTEAQQQQLSQPQVWPRREEFL